jgi:hypothetical protein
MPFPTLLSRRLVYIRVLLPIPRGHCIDVPFIAGVGGVFCCFSILLYPLELSTEYPCEALERSYPYRAIARY